MEQMKVLIVDDNQQVRLLLRDYLPPSVDEIFECGDGDKAVALYRKHLPDWVLMDWVMPNMDGITAIREIIAEFPQANICMVSAFDEADIRTAALADGMLLMRDDGRVFLGRRLESEHPKEGSVAILMGGGELGVVEVYEDSQLAFEVAAAGRVLAGLVEVDLKAATAAPGFWLLR